MTYFEHTLLVWQNVIFDFNGVLFQYNEYSWSFHQIIFFQVALNGQGDFPDSEYRISKEWEVTVKQVPGFTSEIIFLDLKASRKLSSQVLLIYYFIIN